MPNVTDWDALNQFILEQGMLVLLQRRVSAAVWKELLELGTEVPGIESFTKRDVNIRVS